MRKKPSLAVLAVAIACAAPFAHAATASTNGLPPSDSGDPALCEQLRMTPTAVLPNPTTVVTEAHYLGATPADAKTPALPDHCLLRGYVARRIGVDGQRYQISFELRLPTVWNRRFLMVGGGGTNGVLIPALGATGPNRQDTALGRGFAVVSTDGGHDNTVDNRADAFGSMSFGMDPQARLDQGFNAYDQVTRLAKALVNRYYGTAASHSYFTGCSEGGREGMMFTQRYPEAYDGVVVGDPGFHIPRMSAVGAWTSKAFAAISTQRDPDGAPLINKTFTDHDLQLLRSAVLESCDALDGAKDGLVMDMQACQKAFDPLSARLPENRPLMCAGAKQDDCLTRDQLDAMKRAFSAAVNSGGRELYPKFPWDAGVGGTSAGTFNEGWRSWWLGSYGPDKNSAARLNLWSQMSGLVDWSTPPMPMPASKVAASTLAFDLDADTQRIERADQTFTISSTDFSIADSTDLRVFAARGGHMLIYHGVSDAAFSANDTIQWFEAMSAEMSQRGADVARLYLVPGMNHCTGGPSTDRFDALDPLVDWVENGKAPASIPAEASHPGYFGATALSRPLCPYPQVARYKGGDMGRAESFACQP